MMLLVENMKEEDGQDIPFNNQNLKEMMEDAYWLRAVFIKKIFNR